MTAEIAILNRTAVALAADSVVTLAGEGRRKTYDSAEKIFELSKYQPIGLMLYNNAQFMNAPLEVLIRNYRENLSTGKFSKLVQVWPDLEKFLLSFKHSHEDELDHLNGMAIAELGSIRDMMLDHMLRGVSRRTKKGAETLESLVVRRMKARQAEAEERPLNDFPAEATLEAFKAAYGGDLDGLAGASLRYVKIEGEVREALHAMMFAVIRSTIRSAAFTGIVLAGFGTEDIFPTLYAVEIDGVYFGRFRILETKLVDIDRRGETAAVVPFAQKDMPERFIFGIDHEFEDAVESLAASLVGQVIDQKKRAFAGGLGEKVKATAAEQFREGLDRLKKRNAYNLNSVVNHLSKKELGEVASHLVELTSRKRRYSNELETVGGPIDVAILTRNEGFVWVRRKHYFDAEMNPRYRQRQ